MNGFEKHGINHLSISSCNTFQNERALWCMERLLGKKGSVGTAAHRGTAIEAGVQHGLLHPDAAIDECAALAESTFDRLAALSGDPNREKHRDQIAPSVAVALEELRQYGVPDICQGRVSVMLPEIPIPFLGFLDFGWTEHGCILDLKTTEKLPSVMRPDHARQVALYVYGTNNEARVAYATPKKIGVYRLEDAEGHIRSLTAVAKTMERFLALSSDPAELTALCIPNLDSFYYSDAATRAAAKQVFGM